MSTGKTHRNCRAINSPAARTLPALRRVANIWWIPTRLRYVSRGPVCYPSHLSLLQKRRRVAFHSNVLKFIYTGRTLLPAPFTFLRTPNFISRLIISAVFPMPAFPLTLHISRIEGPNPYFFHHSSIHKNTSFCAGVISFSTHSSNDISLRFAVMSLLINNTVMLSSRKCCQSLTGNVASNHLITIFLFPKIYPPGGSAFPKVRGGLPVNRQKIGVVRVE